jgi:hypothetical protein
MAKQSKIDKYKLEDFTLTMAGEGKTGTQIANALNEYIKTKLEIDDSITQPSVARWLKQIREERKEATQRVVNEDIQKHAVADLQATNDFKNFFYEQFKKESNGLKTRTKAAMNCLKVIETRLRLGGIGGDNESFHPVELQQMKESWLNEFKNDADNNTKED